MHSDLAVEAEVFAETIAAEVAALGKTQHQFLPIYVLARRTPVAVLDIVAIWAVLAAVAVRVAVAFLDPAVVLAGVVVVLTQFPGVLIALPSH